MYLSLPPRPAWHAHAACLGSDPALFYPERGVQPEETARAKRICAGCPVAGECEEAGMSEKHGIWGGLVVTDRNELRRASA